MRDLTLRLIDQLDLTTGYMTQTRETMNASKALVEEARKFIYGEAMKNNWNPSDSDLLWTSNLMKTLKLGGCWGCPAGFSIITKKTEQDYTFLGPLYDGDTLPDEVPADVAAEAVKGCLLCNRRIIRTMELLGFTITHAESGKPVTTNTEWDLT